MNQPSPCKRRHQSLRWDRRNRFLSHSFHRRCDRCLGFGLYHDRPLGTDRQCRLGRWRRPSKIRRRCCRSWAWCRRHTSHRQLVRSWAPEGWRRPHCTLLPFRRHRLQQLRKRRSLCCHCSQSFHQGNSCKQRRRRLQIPSLCIRYTRQHRPFQPRM